MGFLGILCLVALMFAFVERPSWLRSKKPPLYLGDPPPLDPFVEELNYNMNAYVARYHRDHPSVFSTPVAEVRVLDVSPPAPEPTEPESPPVFFKPGEPQTFDDYDGQEHVTEYLAAAIRGLDPTQCAISPQCFIGFAGTGKTLLAKIVAETLRRRAEHLRLPKPAFIEAFPADLGDLDALDTLMGRVQQNPGCVLFIDEVHDLAGSHSLKLFLVLEERRYAARGSDYPVELPPFTFLAATTDFGAMHPALQRRFQRQQFKPATPEQLVEYVLRRGQKFPIARTVAERIVSRTKDSGAPWEAIELYEMAGTMARGRGSLRVDDQDVARVFELQGIDDLGLRWFDQRVVKVLFTSPRYRNAKGGRELVCYGASESDLCMMAQVDLEEYRRSIRPRLMTRGLLTMRPGYGQALTDKAVALYGTP
jgi:Holliday junction resolvasome RuvABC ATP-dependent DNA helicase subunit